MAKKFYLKELVDQPLYLPNGAKLSFQPAGGSYGILETDHPGLITELDKAANNHVGGIIPLTEPEYDEWKKKATEFQSQPPSQQQRGRETLEPIPFDQIQALRAAGRAAVVSGPIAPAQFNPVVNSPSRIQQQAQQQRVEPIEVPTQFSKPKVGRLSQKPATPDAPKAPPPPASPTPTP